MSVPHAPAGELPSGDGIATVPQVPEKSSSYVTLMAPAAHEGCRVTVHAPQLHAFAALGPSTRSWLGAVSKPVGQGEAWAGAKATSVHPLGTPMHGAASFGHAPGGGGTAFGASFDASGMGLPGAVASGWPPGFVGRAFPSLSLASPEVVAASASTIGVVPSSSTGDARPPRPTEHPVTNHMPPSPAARRTPGSICHSLALDGS